MPRAPATGSRRLAVAVRAAPALAGGPLRLLNRILQVCGVAAARTSPGESWGALLVLDPSLVRNRDRDLLLLNAFGDPCALPGPPNGILTSDDRAYLRAAALDSMPPTRAAATVLDRLLPPPDTDPLHAAAALWRDLMGPAGLEVATGTPASTAPPAAILAAPAEIPEEWRGAEVLEPREVTWLGPRHLQLLRQLGLSPQAALAGEDALRRAATPGAGGRVLEEARLLAASVQQRLRGLELAIEEEPDLRGNAHRLRRQVRRATDDFLRSAERVARNRAGIRGARLHALAQALRPHGEPQEERLGLAAAAALFGLDLDRLAEHAATFARAPAGTPLLLEAESGQILASGGPAA